jgi:hypothetical protein
LTSSARGSTKTSTADFFLVSSSRAGDKVVKPTTKKVWELAEKDLAIQWEDSKGLGIVSY